MIKKIILLLLGVVFYASNAHALTIGPGRFETRLPPGEVAGIDYYAQNETDAPVHVVVEPENWARDAYDYGKLDIKDWVTLDCYEFDLKPMEIKKLKLTVRVPKDAKGELVAQIFFTSSAAEGPPGSVRARLGAVLYVAVRGTEIVKAGIRSMDINDIPEKNQIKVNVTVRNDGNVHIRPREGRVLIEDLKGQRIALLDMVTESAALPGRERVFSVTADKSPFREGAYIVLSEIKFGNMYGREKTAKFRMEFGVDKDGRVAVK